MGRVTWVRRGVDGQAWRVAAVVRRAGAALEARFREAGAPAPCQPGGPRGSPTGPEPEATRGAPRGRPGWWASPEGARVAGRAASSAACREVDIACRAGTQARPGRIHSRRGDAVPGRVHLCPEIQQHILSQPDMPRRYSFSNPWLLNFRDRQFSVTILTVCSGTPSGTSARISSVTSRLAPMSPARC